MKFTVIVMRPLVFMELLAEFNTVQDLQYVATGIESNNGRNERRDAGLDALQEAFYADLHAEYPGAGRDLFGLKAGDYTVLGTIEDGGEYTPWLSGDRP